MKIVFLYAGYENLGIEYLSACLKKAGHEVELVYDPVLFNECGGINIKPLAKIFSYKGKILKEITKVRPDLVCFSVVSDEYSWACNLAKEIKQRIDATILFGGIHPTSVPEKVIRNDFVDMVCVGEGEEAIVELANSMEKGRKDYSIRNIWFKDKKGKVIRNPVRPLIQNLDLLPSPDKELFYEKVPQTKIGYGALTSRGCPYICSYCCNNFLRKLYKGQKYLRRRSVKNVIDELRYAKEKYKIKFVRFDDEVFAYDLDWLKEFSEEYKSKINLPYFCTVHPNNLSCKIVKCLKYSGCMEVQIGVQTMNEKIRKKVLQRPCTNKQIEQSINLLKNAGIRVATDNIFGLPNQTEKDYINLANFYNENMPDLINIYWLRHYPRTDITINRKNLFKNDILNINSKGYSNIGDTYKKSLAKYQTLLVLFHFLPKNIRLFLLNNRIKFLPGIHPVIITIILRFFKKAKFDLRRSRIIRRYFNYCLLKPFY